MKPDLSHLLDDDPNLVPDSPPPIADMPSYLTVRPGSGLRVNQYKDDVIVSAEPESEFQSGGGGIVYIDPLKYASFRAKLIQVDDEKFVQIQDSWVDYIEYDGEWIFVNFKVPSETIPISVFPQYLYLRFPVKFISGRGLTADNNFPFQFFTSEPQTINAAPYVFNQTLTTGFITRDGSVDVSNYFILSPLVISDNVLTPDADGFDARGYWYFNIGTVTEAGVQQPAIGALTLPQPFTSNIIEFSVS